MRSIATGSFGMTSNTPLPPGGRIVDQLAITMDWTATILAVGNTKPDPAYPLDGIDLLPLLRHPSSIQHLTSSISTRPFFWRNSNQSALLKGHWKYLHDGTNEYLFNLSVDQRERANFREQNPAMFEELKKDFKEWESTVLPRPPARVRQL